MKPLVTMRKALGDPKLLGSALQGPSWLPWRTMLLAMMGEALTTEERALFRELTQRDHEPSQRVEEFAAVVGRRGGKSRSMSVLAAYLAGLCDYRDVLVPGEQGVLLVIAPDKQQAGIIVSYCRALFETTMLRSVLHRVADDEIELTTGLTVEVRGSSFRRLRGPSYIGVICDESAFYYNDQDGSLNSDSEILNAIRPGLATTGGPLILCSSPYARRGELWEAYRRNFGPNGDPLLLVAQGASRVFNPSLKQSVIDRAYERDPASAESEYGANFRTDLEDFINREAVNACIDNGVYERPPVERTAYVGFVDPAGGSGQDSMTLAIAHRGKDRTAILDCIREVKPPFSPAAVVSDFATVAKSYGISALTGDHWGGEFVREPFKLAGIRYELAEKTKSDLYRDSLPLLNSGAARLLDNQRLINQICGLERRTARGGRDSIDHRPNAHDDVANAALACLVKLGTASHYTAALNNAVTNRDSYLTRLRMAGMVH
jgi:hypothetical protein